MRDCTRCGAICAACDLNGLPIQIDVSCRRRRANRSCRAREAAWSQWARAVPTGNCKGRIGAIQMRTVRCAASLLPAAEGTVKVPLMRARHRQQGPHHVSLCRLVFKHYMQRLSSCILTAATAQVVPPAVRCPGDRRSRIPADVCQAPDTKRVGRTSCRPLVPLALRRPSQGCRTAAAAAAARSSPFQLKTAVYRWAVDLLNDVLTQPQQLS